MKPEEKLRGLISKSDVATSPETDGRILGDALEHVGELKQKKTTSAHPEPNIWRTIMKNKTKRLAAAAVIALAVVGGMTFWPGHSSDSEKWWLGSPAAWGQEILAALDTVKAVTCREQHVTVFPDGSEHTSMTWDIFYVSHDSYRRDIYDGDVLREIQWYVPDGDNMVQCSVRFDLESYFTQTHTGKFGIVDPVEGMRFYVGLLDEAVRLLGTEVIDGCQCVGFEISTSKYEISPGQGIDRIWFDVETKLPVRIEHRGMPITGHPDETGTIIQDQFDYNPDLAADTFVPKTPEGFVFGHPDDVQIQAPKK
jgi:outer membrane lipoprotein-sorting protein